MWKTKTGPLFLWWISMFFGDESAFAQRFNNDRIVPSLAERTAPELLVPIIKEYLSLTDFDSRNGFAFRFANRWQSGDWLIRVAANASNPKLLEEEKHCVFHLASAMCTKNAGTVNMNVLLNLHDDVLTMGVLNILLESRELSPDGSDHSWPHSGPMGNSCIRAELVKLLAIPKFSKKASEVLGCYGEKGIDAIHKLVPVLLLDDASSQLAAASAILAIDPNGVAKTIGLTANEPLSSSQKKKISDWIRSQRLKPQPPFEQVLHYVKETSAMAFEEQRAAAKRWKLNEYDSEWWAQLVLVADISPDHYLQTLQVLFSELYSMPNSKKEIIKVLQGKDRSAIRGMLFLLEGFFHFEPGSSIGRVPKLRVYDDDLVFWPRYVATVLDRFPDLSVEVARTLAMYPGAEAKKEAKRVIPFMLTNDPNQTIRLRRFFTDIDKETATMLGIAMSGEEELMASLSDQARVLTPEQRTKVQSFLRK